MSTLSLLPVSLLESFGLSLIQQGADAALGSGVLTLSADSGRADLGLKLSGGQTVNVDNVMVNSAGLSAHIFIDGLAANPLSATLFDGFTVALTAFDLTFANGGLAASHIGGHLTIPFFTDKNGDPETLDIEIGTKSDGSLSISLSAVESTQGTTLDGLVQLVYDLPGGIGSVEIDVASIEIDKNASGLWTVIVSGNLIITTADLNWPSIELRKLGIDSKGHISLDGGWIDLPSQMSLDFYGFHIALQKLGFGSDPTGKWIGFNGDIHLVEGLSLGGSVRGLRINLSTGAVSLDGVSISFEIPDVLTIDGEIDHVHAEGSKQDFVNAGLNGSLWDVTPPVPSPTNKKVDVFAGGVKVVIEAAGGLEVDANFITGTFGGQSVFFLYIDAELPVGIPIFLDVALYGLEGLIATGLQPNPEASGNTWWQWYKYPASGPGGPPDLNQPPDYDANDVNKWLVPKSGAFAIGAGATIGTEADDGFTASAAIAFILMLPGPVISFIGKANILSKRIGGASEDANFEAMATYDGNAGTFDLTIDAHYSIPIVLDIEATAELYVDATAGEWYFALGKPPHEKRVKARIFDLFETDAYFVISDTGLVTGTWTGYKNSWSFGPLSASIDAYLATLAAIQWSPLQIAGGIELYGNIHLSAFGIGFGLTADALLEGCAPNPFWVHGELQVELDLPWPLPNIGATISLSWGGDDGTVPPAPLALSHLDASLIDHADSAGKHASDHYVLLAHHDNGIRSDLPIQYDGGKPGILDFEGASLTAWQARIAQNPILPDLVPDNNSTVQLAALLPQDSHFTLNFAHPTIDATGVSNNAIPWSNTPGVGIPKDADIETETPPSIVGKDDMSNINPTPPSVQFDIRHSLTSVSLYEFDTNQSIWNMVCSVPPGPPANISDLPVDTTVMSTVWLTGDPAKANPKQVMTQLKVVPWRLLPGQPWSAQWNAQSQPATRASFTDQGLQFTLNGVDVSVGAYSFYAGVLPGLRFTLQSGAANPSVTIRFPQASVLNSVIGISFEGGGEIIGAYAPACSAGGSALTPQSSSQDSQTSAWTETFIENAPAIQEFTIGVNNLPLILYGIGYSTAPVPMAILPEAPALYAVETVTKIEAARVGASSYQVVPNGNPIVEFVYFQTAAGPGTAMPLLPSNIPPPVPHFSTPVPVEDPPFPQLVNNCQPVQQPVAASPLGGSALDLHTYTQWSWPLDGALTAYYGYDLNVEFVESYVNALYTAFSNGSIPNSLHFRCVDRNNLHTLLVPNAIHVPSIPQQSALVAAEYDTPLPKALEAAQVPIHVTPVQLKDLQTRASPVTQAGISPDPAPAYITPLHSTNFSLSGLGERAGILAIQQISPGAAIDMLHQFDEESDRQQALAIWFQPLQPSTRYTLDVVAGPWLRSERGDFASVGSAEASLQAVYQATDAISALAALEAYFKYEDSLTTLKRVQFTTSRYATFSAQMSNPVSQLASASGATPIRRYVAATSPIPWLGAAPTQLVAAGKAIAQYSTDRNALQTLVANFNPLADDLQPGIQPATNGAAALVKSRQQTASDWSAVVQAFNGLYDGLIAALGHPEWVSKATPIRVPDTEVSLFTDSPGFWVQAILLESPEPLPWQRIWRSISLTSGTNPPQQLLPVWSADGTRAVLIPLQFLVGVYNLNISFQGNIGAEAPCITQGGNPVTDSVQVGGIRMGEFRRRLTELVPSDSVLHVVNLMRDQNMILYGAKTGSS